MGRDPQWGPAPPEFVVPDGLRRDLFNAMGTCVSVLVPEQVAGSGFRAVRALFEAWEQTLSRFRPDSELSYVNARASRPVIVSALFLRVLRAALDAARATNGIYDPTLLHQVVGAGYDRSFAELAPTGPALSYHAAPGGGWRSIRLDPDRGMVTLPAGVALDLGGIAKGMAVDAAMDLLAGMGAACAAVEAGGDLRVHGLPPGQTAWPVAVQLKESHETVALRRGALATSSVSRRTWTRGDVKRHHLLDPRTGESTRNGMWSVTVSAPRCAQADVAAKTALVLGAEGGARFLAERGLTALLVTSDGERRPVGPWAGALQENAL